MDYFTIAFWMAVFTLIGDLSNAIGLTQPLFTRFDVATVAGTITVPLIGSSCSGALFAVFGPLACLPQLQGILIAFFNTLVFIGNALLAVVQIATFQVQGISSELAAIVILPIDIAIVVIIVKIARG